MLTRTAAAAAEAHLALHRRLASAGARTPARCHVRALSTRLEHDSLGEVEVPASRLWGAQTQRALLNFKIGEPDAERMPHELVMALGNVKRAAAQAGGRALAAVLILMYQGREQGSVRVRLSAAVRGGTNARARTPNTRACPSLGVAGQHGGGTAEPRCGPGHHGRSRRGAWDTAGVEGGGAADGRRGLRRRQHSAHLVHGPWALQRERKAAVTVGPRFCHTYSGAARDISWGPRAVWGHVGSWSQVASGRLADHFPLPIWCAGAWTGGAA